MDMDEELKKVLTANSDILVDKNINHINVGFTNTIYSVNDQFIIKICTDLNNEKNMEKEINFYLKNENNSLIPKLYRYDLSKNIIPFYYEIIEKLPGSSLYDLWHTFSDGERENIIAQICDVMRMFHRVEGDKIDWNKYLKELYLDNLHQVKKLNVFSSEEIKLLDKAYDEFDKYLKVEKSYLVHNDIHFDNIIYNAGQIKIIDFERSIYAPIDFELDIFLRMVNNPQKFASEEIEKYVQKKDYSQIETWLKKYYPEIFSVSYLDERLAIYDIIYYLNSIIDYPHLESLKINVLQSLKKLLK